jgi:gliding motility-associated-like protein
MNGSVTNQTGIFLNLPGGSHQISIADANACTIDTSVVILTPPPIVVDILTITDVTGCYGDSNGVIFVSGSGGSAQPQYSLNGGALQPGGTFGGLTAGTYTLTLDDGSCTLDTVVVVSQPDPISLASGLAIPITCAGSNNGRIEVLGAGGTPPLTYTLNPGSIENNTGVFSDLPPGIYSVDIKDSEGCVGVDTSLTLTDPPLFVLNSVTSKDISCYEAADGTIISSVSGGVPPYQYSVDNQASWSSDSIIGDLEPGTYEVYIRDANLCTLPGGSFTMTDPAAITATVNITHITTCPGDTSGVIEIVGAGGTGDLEYSLDGIDYQSSRFFMSLAAGEYTIFIQDATGCIYTAPATVNEPDPLTATITKTDAIYGQLGSIAISESSGGTPPYEYSINGDAGPFTTDTIYTDLEAATYHVIMRDLNACTYEQMIEILDVPPLDMAVNITHVTCFGENNGSILFIPQNAEGEVNYSIDSGMNFVPDPLFENLPGTTYYLVALDALGKLFTGMVSILEPSELMISQVITPAQCNAFSETGAIDVTVTGGTGPYTYLWSDGSTEEDRINIGAGDYTLVATDNNDCFQTTSMNVSSEVLVFAYAGEDTTICHGESIQLNGQGGYTATWDPSPFLSETDVADPVTLGITENTTFVLTITEDVSLYGCYNKDSISVSLFPQTDLSVTEDTFVILGTSVQLDAVGGPFMAYRWEPATGLNSNTIPNPIATPPESIRYYVYATSENGCVVVDSVNIEVIEDLKVYNAFSPNGDGINEYFEIEHSERFPEMLVEIYSRWGSLLYSSVGYDSGKNWDGNYRGKEAPVGTYYYVIIPYSGAKPITGNVTIIR